MTLHTIRLELAREPKHPEGSPQHGYEFTAPLDRDGHFDAGDWRNVRSKCTMRRFWQGEDDQSGNLIRTRGGHWAFSYDPDTDADDEVIFRFHRHVFKPGEYVSVTEPGGEQHTFRVVATKPVHL